MKKNEMPLVSYVVPMLNSREYLPDFTKSYLKINYPNRELFFIDDGSTDGSVEYIEKSFKGRKLIYTIIRNSIRLGIPKSRTLEITNAKGQYIAFAETDMVF